MEFLQTCLDESKVPMGLKWNVHINVMEPNEEISHIIQQQ